MTASLALPGDMVNYVLPADSRSAGQVRGAIVVRAFASNPADVMLNLQVFTDGSNDRMDPPLSNVNDDPYARGMIWKTSVHQDEAGKTPGTWHLRPAAQIPLDAPTSFGDALNERELTDWSEPDAGIKRIPSTSSNVASFGYSASQRLLEVEFRNGGLYRYKDVPVSVYNEMLTADSVGSFIAKQIKDVFAFDKVDAT